MSHFERPEWYEQAASHPFQKQMFTENHKQRILRLIQEEERKKDRRLPYIGKLIMPVGIIAAAVIAVFLWGNVGEHTWFAMNSSVHPSENGKPVEMSKFADWNEDSVFLFLHEAEQHVRTIPIETISKELVMEQYERYFSPELSEKIFDSLYMEREGKWMIPDGDGGLMFYAPNREQNEITIFANDDAIIVEEKYEAWMYSRVRYTITYEDKPVISGWTVYPDDYLWNQFDAATVQIGDIIANMEVVQLHLQEAENLYFGTVQFQGKTLLTGTLTYTHDDTGEHLLFTPDADSANILPRMTHDTRAASFYFQDRENVKERMGIPENTKTFSRTSAVEIDHYMINYQETDVFNVATLINVYDQIND